MSDRLFLRLDEDALHGPEATVPAGSIAAFGVEQHLRTSVRDVMSYRETLPAGDEVRERVVPDGSVRLVFNFAEAPSVGQNAGLRMEAVGASIKPAVVSLRGRVEALSVTLRPGAVAALLGVAGGEIQETAVPLDQLWGPDAHEAYERMAVLDSDNARARVLQLILQRRLNSTPSAGQPAALRAAKLIAASEGRRPLREVASAIGVGERRMQQLFYTHVGLSPRAWSRLVRIQGCLRALRLQRDPQWAGLATSCGFYDQAHLANEFRTLCGETPTEFFARTISGSSKTSE